MFAKATVLRPAHSSAVLTAAGGPAVEQSAKVADLVRREGVSLAALLASAGLEPGDDTEALVTVEVELKYAGYFERERRAADRLRRMGEFPLPTDLPYPELQTLSFEARQKLAGVRPSTLAQASRIPGVSPSDLQNLVLEVERRRRRSSAGV